MKLSTCLTSLLLPLALIAGQGCAPAKGGAAEGPTSDMTTDSGGTGAGDTLFSDEAVTPQLPDSATADPVNPVLDLPEQFDAATVASSYRAAILLFNGLGISASDWQNTERIIKSMGLSYRLVNSSQLNAMTLDQMASFGSFVVPGGHSGGISSGLSRSTRIRVRQAVRDRGVGYLGFCAGAWVGVGLEAASSAISNWGFAAIYGNHLANWWPNGNTSKVAAITPVKFADGSTRRLVWWGGPATPEWKGGVIARYNNGKAAMSQGTYGKGFVVLSGPHPEAPQGWRSTAGYDSDGLDYEVAKDLIRAALNHQPLRAF